jgi:hypothetical protein
MDCRRPSRFRPEFTALEGRHLLSRGVPVVGPLSPVTPLQVWTDLGVSVATDPAANRGTIRAESAPVVYKVKTLTHLNQFQDSVWAVANGGHNLVRFTLGSGTVSKVGDTFKENDSASWGVYWMIVAKSPLAKGAASGEITVSRVDKWYNNRPAIKGLDYTQPIQMNVALFNRVKLGDLIRRVPNVDPSKPPYWKPDSDLTETEKLLVREFIDLPNLREGPITEVGPSSDQYNCYAYAANRSNPGSIGWVAGKEGPPADAQKWVGFHTRDELLNIVYKPQGWRVVSYDPNKEHPVPPTGLVVIYLDSYDNPTHAAFVDSSGVYAKMGQLGTFRFGSLDQMAGGSYGYPGVWLERTR